MFDKLLEEHPVIQVFNWRCFSHPDLPREIEIIQLSTNVGDLFLRVNVDTDELFWSNECQELHEYQLTKPQLNLKPCIILEHWLMTNYKGYEDAIQFEIRSEGKSTFIQFIAIASGMKYLIFNDN